MKGQTSVNYALTPIETVYKGYKFRSRLEARWAVFFEEMGLDWSYEVEGFNLPSGARYLPDFLVKGHKNGWDYYYEIKPKGTDPCRKVEELKSVLRCNQSRETSWTMSFGTSSIGQQIRQLNGDPVDCVTGICPRCKLINSVEFLNFRGELNDYFMCDNCDESKGFYDHFVEIDECEIGGAYYNLEWDKGSIRTKHGYDGRWLTPLYIMTNEACLAARQARFDGRSGGNTIIQYV
jgi:hypothetical protein